MPDLNTHFDGGWDNPIDEKVEEIIADDDLSVRE